MGWKDTLGTIVDPLGIFKPAKAPQAMQIDPTVAQYGGKYGGMTDEQVKAKDLADLEKIRNEQPPPPGVKPETEKRWRDDHVARVKAAEALVKDNPELTSFARVEGRKLKEAGAAAKGQMDQLGSAQIEQGQGVFLDAQGRGNTLTKQGDAAYATEQGRGDALAQLGQAAYATEQGRGDALNVTAETLQNRTNPQIDKAALAGAAGLQQTAIGKLQNIMNQGPGESQAQAQLRMGTNKAIAASGSLARSGRGFGVDAASRRDALMTQADQVSNLNMQQAVIRAQEQDAERGRQLQGANSIIGAQGDARNQTLAGEKTIAETALTGRGQNDSAANAARGQAGSAFGEGNAARLGLQTQAGNAFAEGNDARLGLANQAGNTYAEGNSARLGLQAQAAQNFASGTDAQRGYGQDANALVTGQTNERVNLATGNANRDAAAKVAGAEAAAKQKAGIIGGGATVAAAAISDIRAKQNIRDVDVAGELDKLRGLTSKQAPPTARYADLGEPPTRAYDIRPAQPYSYEYTAEARAKGQDSGTKVGPMAQDLEQTPLRGAVITGKDGMKSIDTGRLSLGLTGAVAEQQTKIDELDAELARLRGLKSKGGGNDVVSDFYRAGGGR